MAEAPKIQPKAVVRDDGAIKDKIDLGDHVLIEKGNAHESTSVEEFLYNSKYHEFGDNPKARLDSLAKMKTLKSPRSLSISSNLKDYMSGRLEFEKELKDAIIHVEKMTWPTYGVATVQRQRVGLTNGHVIDASEAYPHHWDLHFKGNAGDLTIKLEALSKWTQSIWSIDDIIAFNSLMGNDLKHLTSSDQEQSITIHIPYIAGNERFPLDRASWDQATQNAKLELLINFANDIPRHIRETLDR